VAARHPFLFRSRAIDAAAAGEGERVFPAILRAFRGGPAPDYENVFWRTGDALRPGDRAAPPVDLAADLPPAGDPRNRPDRRGTAYLETVRGCPLRCSYCRYAHQRRRLSWIDPDEIAARIEVLRRRGARHVRFIDPAFNAHPRFDAVLAAIAAVNRDRRLSFFAELQAERLTAAQAAALARARFADIEIGLQSRDPAVLRAIRRPARLSALDRGVGLLVRRRLRVTIDIMYGLPRQQVGDVLRSLRWALRRPRANVQCLQTLLLPGTELRAQRQRWRMPNADRPPYGVTATATLPAADIRRIERFVAAHPKLRSDCPARRFVGFHLPDLFPERIRLPIRPHIRIPGAQCRRALLLASEDLFAQRVALRQIVRAAVIQEPHLLWQFVLVPAREEPLDLFDALAAEIRAFAPHLLDRYAGAAADGRIAARRVFVQLRRGRAYARAWIRAAKDLLQAHFI
jgi:hypothetical protein